MPAAAVIPAPLAYIKVVAVKKLVVELLAVRGFGFTLNNTNNNFTGFFNLINIFNDVFLKR